jgi:hypothetical protein
MDIIIDLKTDDPTEVITLISKPDNRQEIKILPIGVPITIKWAELYDALHLISKAHLQEERRSGNPTVRLSDTEP